jgi:glycosyltransferase involved in cell wall biosynthesis
VPRVSVIIPSFNCARYVGTAIESVLNQTYRDYEIIVVDDGSTDGTAETVNRYRDKVRYFYQANSGVSSARNLALKVSSGAFVAYLDADDLWYPQKLDRQMQFFDAHSDCGFLHSDVTVIDEEDRIVHARFNAGTARSIPQGYCTPDLLQRCHIQTPTVVERRECVEKIGGFDEQLPIAQDYMHWIRISLNGWAFGYIDEPLAKYRWRTGSLMGSRKRLLEDYETIYSTLLKEQAVLDRGDCDAGSIVMGRLCDTRRELAYIDRIEGNNVSARGRIAWLIQQSPLRIDLYFDLIKSCIHPILWRKLLTIRGYRCFMGVSALLPHLTA